MLTEDFNVHNLVKSLANTNRYKITPLKDFAKKLQKMQFKQFSRGLIIFTKKIFCNYM